MVKKIKKNWKTYHLVERKTGNIRKYWVYGDSPSEIRRRVGTYNQKELALVPTSKNYTDTVSSIKKYLRKAKKSKLNLKKARARKK